MTNIADLGGMAAANSTGDRRSEGIPLPGTRDDNQALDLTCVKDAFAISLKNESMWEPISTAPFDRDLELAVIDKDGPHALVFPCRRVLTGWIKSTAKEWIDISPTHWRIWEQDINDA
ncbi:hypothetical protein [Mesorhizobium amorphae]|uniref:hypothetical protein n=1 Tax=Mesorhizobium amorphae TaxID=71433 RepID=UPI001FCC2F05|nr:hypothetical protein [Mesorhizobium amorphae]GLR39878.1 hypothetical protein GCM10007880_03940 [Mesorhizobium amorphae]